MTLQEKLNQKAKTHVQETGKEAFLQELHRHLIKEGFSKCNGFSWKLSSEYEGFRLSIKVEGGNLNYFDALLVRHCKYDVKIIRVSLQSSDGSFEESKDFSLEEELINVLEKVKDYLEDLVDN